MTAYELSKRLANLIKTERQTTNEILQLLNFALENKSYLELGCSSLFNWLVEGFGYSNAAAYRRIEAARLLKKVPTLAPKLESGAVNLSTLCQTQTFLKAHREATNESLSIDKTVELIEKLEHKSTAESQKILAEHLPTAALHIPKEVRRTNSPNSTRVTIQLDEGAIQSLDRAKELLSHHCAGDSEVIAYALRFLLSKKDPLKIGLCRGQDLKNSSEVGSARATENRAENKQRPPNEHKNRSHLRRLVFRSSRGACTFRDPLTGKVCGSRFKVQIDHILPKALGGKDRPANLRPLCQAHNLLMAERWFGKSKIGRHKTESHRNAIEKDKLENSPSSDAAPGLAHEWKQFSLGI